MFKRNKQKKQYLIPTVIYDTTNGCLNDKQTKRKIRKFEKALLKTIKNYKLYQNTDKEIVVNVQYPNISIICRNGNKTRYMTRNINFWLSKGEIQYWIYWLLSPNAHFADNGPINVIS